MNIWRILVLGIALGAANFMLLPRLLVFIGKITMSKSELDQSELIKMVAKALAISGNFFSLSH